MYRPNDLQNITYVWSNTEGLMGDDITFLVCRALIKLEPERYRIEKVIGINGKNKIDAVSWHENPKGVQGQLLLDLDLGDRGELLKLALPYRVPVKTQRLGQINPEVKFVHAKKVGVDSLLIEGIITLTSLGYLPWRGAVNNIGGVFSDNCTVKLDKLLPEVKEMVSAQIRFNPLSHNLKEGILTMSGWKEIHLMYIAQGDRGEKVVVTRQVEPFTKEIILNTNLSAYSYWEISNGNIESFVIGPREVMVTSDFQLLTQQAPFITPTNNTNSILKDIKEMRKLIKNRKKIKQEEKPEKINAPEEKEMLPEVEVPLKRQEVVPVEKNEKSFGLIPRESKRAKLSKYMRQLAD